MKKYFLLVVFASLLSISAFAQTALSLNYAPMFPVTKYNGELKAAVIGANAKLKYFFDDYLAVNIGVGYYRYDYKTFSIGGVLTPVSDANVSIIPVTAGAELYFTADKVRPYLSLDAGYVMSKYGGASATDTRSRNNFIVAPALGVLYQMSDNFGLSAAVRNNLVIYNYRDIPDSRESFQAIGVELGVLLRF